jgi:hypothetical protein
MKSTHKKEEKKVRKRSSLFIASSKPNNPCPCSKISKILQAPSKRVAIRERDLVSQSRGGIWLLP